MIRSRPMVIPAASVAAGMTPPTTPGADPRLCAGPAYADPDIRTTPAGSYHHPRHYAHITDGPPPTPPPPTPGERLRHWRHRHHLRQVQIAATVGVKTWQVSRWERDLDPIPRGTLTRLARAHIRTTR